MATLFQNLQYFKKDGSINAGGSLEWTAAGTSTPKTTWKDEAETTPHANPIVLGSDGYPTDGPVFIRGSYKLIVKDSDGVVQFTADNINEYDSYDFTGLTATIADLNSTTTTALLKSTTYDIQVGDRGKTILCNASTGSFNVNLLAAATAGNKYKIIIKKTDVSLNTVTIAPAGAETIDVRTNYVLYDYNDFIEVHCDGSNWKLVASQIRGTIQTITTTPTIDLRNNGNMYNCNASGASFSINLPASATVGRGYMLEFKKTDATANTVTITPNGAETIDGDTSLTLETQNQFYGIKSDGNAWYIVNETISTNTASTGFAQAFLANGSTSAPPGWILWIEGTIGNTASNATIRANPDTEDLFTWFWDEFTIAECQIQDSAGTPVAKGASAAADWAANRRITTPWGFGSPLTLNNRAIGIEAATTGNPYVGGSNSVSIGLNSHAPHTHGVQFGNNAGFNATHIAGKDGAISYVGTQQSQSQGSSAPFSVKQATAYLRWIIKL